MKALAMERQCWQKEGLRALQKQERSAMLLIDTARTKEMSSDKKYLSSSRMKCCALLGTSPKTSAQSTHLTVELIAECL